MGNMQMCTNISFTITQDKDTDTQSVKRLVGENKEKEIKVHVLPVSLLLLSVFPADAVSLQ